MVKSNSKDVIDGRPLYETTMPKRGTSSAGLVIGLVVGILSALLWGIGVITIILTFIAYKKNALIGGLMLTIFGILWLVVPWALWSDDKMFGVAFLIIFLPAGLMNMLTGILFLVASGKKVVQTQVAEIEQVQKDDSRVQPDNEKESATPQ